MKLNSTKLILGLFSIMLAALLFITIKASLGESVISAVNNLWPDDWFKATIVDFYNNQLIIYLWMIYKEVSLLKLTILLFLSIGFGSYASIIYILMEYYQYRNFKQVICETRRN